MAKIDKILKFNEGELGRHILNIGIEPDICCGSPLRLFVDKDNELLPGVYFSVTTPTTPRVRTFSTEDDHVLISEDDRNITITVRYDKSPTGWTEDTIQDFKFIIDPTCGDNIPPTEINGQIEWSVMFTCKLEIQKHVEGQASTNPLGIIKGKLHGGLPPYLVILEKNNGKNSDDWRQAPGTPALTLESAGEEFTFDGLDVGFYRLFVEDKRGFFPNNRCEVKLEKTPDLNFNITSPPKNTPCFDEKRYQISRNGAEDGVIRFNLLSNSKPIKIYWEGPFVNEPDLSAPIDAESLETSASLQDKVIKRTQPGNGNGVGDLVNVGAGWYKVTVVDGYKNMGTDKIELKEPKKTKVSVNEDDTSAPCAAGASNGNISLEIEGDPLRNKDEAFEIIWTYNSQTIDLENTSVLDPRANWADRGCEKLDMLDISGLIPDPTRRYNEIRDTTRLTYQGMRAGTYEVTVKDCTGDVIGPISISLEDPEPIRVSISDPLHACSCEAPDDTGAIRVTLSAGRYPFTITLEGEQHPPIEVVVTENEDTNDNILPFTKFIGDIPSDHWTLSVTENDLDSEIDECKDESESFEFSIKKPDSFNFEVVEEETRIPACGDSSNGRVSIVRSNDCNITDESLIIESEPTIKWFANGFPYNGKVDETRDEFGKLKNTISNLSGGIVYQYEITFNEISSLCGEISPIVQTVELDTPPDTEIVFDVTNISKPSESDGAITISINNGTGPYEVKWTGPSGFSEQGTDLFTINTLSKGGYTAFITDANGCTATASVNLEEPPALEAILDEDTVVDGEQTDLTTAYLCKEGIANIAVENVEFFDDESLYPFTLTLSKDGEVIETKNGIDAETEFVADTYYYQFTNLDVGEYTVLVEDSTQQEVEITFTIEVDPALDNPCKLKENFRIVFVANGSETDPVSVLRDMDGNEVLETEEEFVGYIQFRIRRFIPGGIDPEICMDPDYTCCKSFYIELAESSNLEFDQSGIIATGINKIQPYSGSSDMIDIMQIEEVNGANRKMLIIDDDRNITDSSNPSNGSLITLKVKSIDGTTLADASVTKSIDGVSSFLEHELDANDNSIQSSASVAPGDLLFDSPLKYTLYCAACSDENNGYIDCNQKQN